MPYSPIADILDDLRAGKMVILQDDPRRENEGDLVMAAEKVTPEAVHFFLREARGKMCLAMTEERADALHLPVQVTRNTSFHTTAFAVTFDGREGVGTGESARDRAVSILRAADPACTPGDLVRPGHIDPLRARSGGVLVRTGQTEGSVDLCRLAGLQPMAVISVILRDDGEAARLPDLEAFQARTGIRMCCVADVVRARRERERLVEHVVSVKMPTEVGEFDAHLYRSVVDEPLHVALTVGLPAPSRERPPVHAEPILVRAHSECLTGDIFGSLRCDCGPQLREAMRRIRDTGRGVVLYMRQEGRGIGLEGKLRAYHLQEHGLDTVEANERLGFRADERDYGVGAQILLDLGVRKMRLMTNNPKKLYGLEGFGLEVVERVPIALPPGRENARYLDTKREKLGHLLPAAEDRRPPSGA
jgi:3,4-dihydroxy 2-butanone 4-phosphate synthase/GTP cyclohydrolase II